MELKREWCFMWNSTRAVLIVPFMELKQASSIKRHWFFLVLIVPFMELKPKFCADAVASDMS